MQPPPPRNPGSNPGGSTIVSRTAWNKEPTGLTLPGNGETLLGRTQDAVCVAQPGKVTCAWRPSASSNPRNRDSSESGQPGFPGPARRGFVPSPSSTMGGGPFLPRPWTRRSRKRRRIPVSLGRGLGDSFGTLHRRIKVPRNPRTRDALNPCRDGLIHSGQVEPPNRRAHGALGR